MRTPPITRISLLAAAGLVAAAFGTASATASDEGVSAPSTTVAAAAPTTAPVATTVAAPTTAAAPTTIAGATTVAPTTVAGATTTVAAAPSTGLPAGATIADINAAIAQMTGPTTDVIGEFAAFGITGPAGIPTPEGADLREFSLNLYPDADDASYSYYSADVTFLFTALPADVLAMYQSQMEAAGYVQTGTSQETDGDREINFVQYDVPNSTYDSAEVTVGISDGDADFARIDFSDALDPALVAGFGGWSSDLPLVSQATSIDQASISTFNFSSDISVNLGTTFVLPLPLDKTLAQFNADLAGAGYTLDPDYADNDDETIFYLVGGELESLDVYFNEGYPEGTTSMSVSGQFDFQG